MMKLRIEAPWYTFQKKVKALFDKDPDITVNDVVESDNDEEDYSFDILIKNHEKFIAMDRLLPKLRKFGNVILKVYIYDMENSNDVNPVLSLYRTLFDKNPIVKDIVENVDPTGTAHDYVRFQPEVIQFFDDDLSDYSGNWNGLAQDIARELFDRSYWKIGFCTADLRENETGVTKPLGEWP